MVFDRECKHFYDMMFRLHEHGKFHLSCMNRCSSIGNVSTVHVIYDDENLLGLGTWREYS